MRRSGRTTRGIDEAIQELFKCGDVTWLDHAAADGNVEQIRGWKILLRRLWSEHNLLRGENLIVNEDTWNIKLK